MFSTTNRVHTDWRNCSGEKRVENLLRVWEEGTTADKFDYSQQWPDGEQNVPHKEGLISCLVGHTQRHQHLIPDQEATASIRGC